jgi:hypothetical protein
MVVRNTFYSQKLDGLRVWFDNDVLKMLGPSSDAAASARFLAPDIKPTTDLPLLSALCRADIGRSTSMIGGVLIAALEAEVAAMARISLDASSEAARLRGLIGTKLLSANSDLHGPQAQLLDLKQTTSVHEQIALLRTELTRAYQQPFRPVAFFLKHRLMLLASKLAGPISARASERFAASAAKRDPQRFKIQ